MADIFSPDKRSKIMSSIRGVESKPEVLVRKFLFSKGFRYRKNVKNLPGKPDIVLPKYKSIIFVHGCFWHGHEGCKKSALPQTRIEFWETKINGNITRDKNNIASLEELGWKVIIVWQCELNKSKFEKTMMMTINEIN